MDALHPARRQTGGFSSLCTKRVSKRGHRVSHRLVLKPTRTCCYNATLLAHQKVQFVVAVGHFLVRVLCRRIPVKRCGW